jgi:hypothetical protein
MNVLRAPWLKFLRTGGSWWWEATFYFSRGTPQDIFYTERQ